MKIDPLPTTSGALSVDVAMITYNHEQYLATALDSILAQECAFPVRIVVGEDCSNDGTRRILLSYAQRYPDRFQLLLHDTNVGMATNFRSVLSACTAPYVAVLEGDDYWTDPTKLQRQVAFLEANPDYAMCFHNTGVVDEQNRDTGVPFIARTRPESFGIEDLALGNRIPTLTCVYRNVFQPLPQWLATVPIGDFCLHMLAAKHGRIKYLPRIMAAYRVHGGGVWSKTSETSRNLRWFDTLSKLRREFDGEVLNRLSGSQLHALGVALDGASDIGQNPEQLLADRLPAVTELLRSSHQDLFQAHRMARSIPSRVVQTLLQPARWLKGMLSTRTTS